MSLVSFLHTTVLPHLAEFFRWHLGASLRGAGMAVAVFAVQAALGRRLPARWRYALWLAVLVILFAPRLPESRWSVERYAEPIVVRYGFPPEQPGVLVHAESASPAGSNHRPKMTSLRRVSGWEWAGLAWIVGTSGIAAFWLMAHARFLRSIRRDAHTPDSHIHALIEECASELRLRRVPRTLVSGVVESPAVTGFVRPLLLLPSGLNTRFDDDELRLIFLHELAHVKRRDVPWHWLATALLALHWFNPLLWFAAARVHADRELACDALVLGHSTRDARAAYGHTLLKLQSSVGSIRLQPIMVGIVEGAGGVRRRIQRIATFRRGGVVWGAGAALLTAGMLACFATRAEQPGQETTEIATAPPIEEPSPGDTSASPQLTPQPESRKSSWQVEVSSRFLVFEPGTDFSLLWPHIRNVQMPADSAPETPGEWTVAAVILSDQKERFAQSLATATAIPAVKDFVVGGGDTRADRAVPNTARASRVSLFSAPSVTTKSGQRAVIEIIREFRYPSKFHEPAPDAPEPLRVVTPAEFETRNLGVALEVEPRVSADGTRAELEFRPHTVAFAGWRDAETRGGYKIRVPAFSEMNSRMKPLVVWSGSTICVYGEAALPDSFEEMHHVTDEGGAKLRRRPVLVLIEARVLSDHRARDVAMRIVDEVKMDDTPLHTALSHLEARSREIDPWSVGIEIRVTPMPVEEAAALPHVSLNHRGASLLQIVQAAADQVGLDVALSADGIQLQRGRK